MVAMVDELDERPNEIRLLGKRCCTWGQSKDDVIIHFELEWKTRPISPEHIKVTFTESELCYSIHKDQTDKKPKEGEIFVEMMKAPWKKPINVAESFWNLDTNTGGLTIEVEKGMKAIAWTTPFLGVKSQKIVDGVMKKEEEGETVVKQAEGWEESKVLQDARLLTKSKKKKKTSNPKRDMLNADHLLDPKKEMSNKEYLTSAKMSQALRDIRKNVPGISEDYMNSKWAKDICKENVAEIKKKKAAEEAMKMEKAVMSEKGELIYQWEQTDDDVSILVKGPPGRLSKKNIKCEIKSYRVMLELGGTDIFLDDRPWAAIIAEDSAWTLDKTTGEVEITLEKARPGKMWDLALCGKTSGCW